MKDCLLLIFTRNPELGKVKTRLAKTVGDAVALEIYKFLLNHTVNVTQDLACDKTVYYSENVIEDDIWSSSNYLKALQEGADLGERMHNAFSEAFKQYKKVIIIGSDMYDISKKDIVHAFQQLNTNDAVIGPAKDGGYYLLGLKTIPENLFKNKAWGTNTVLENSLADIKNQTVYLLDERNDVDVYDDIKNHQAFQHFIKNL
jgi:hypothetical protein